MWRPLAPFNARSGKYKNQVHLETVSIVPIQNEELLFLNLCMFMTLYHNISLNFKFLVMIPHS